MGIQVLLKAVHNFGPRSGLPVKGGKGDEGPDQPLKREAPGH